MVTAAMILKYACSLEESYHKPRQYVKKQRHHFVNKGPYIVKAMVFPVVMYGCESWTIKKAVYALSHYSCVWLFATLWTIAHQAPRSMVFSRQQYRSQLPVPSPGDLPDPRIKPNCLMFPALAVRSFTISTTWEALSFWTVVLQKSLESPLEGNDIKSANPKGNQSWIFIARTEDPILWPPDVKSWLIGKRPWCW